GNGNTLALATGQLYATLTDLGIQPGVAVGIVQVGNKGIGFGLATGFQQFRFAGIGFAVQNIVAHAAVQQRGILSNHTNMLAQGILGDAADILAIDQNAGAGQGIQTQQQVHQRRFAGAGAANQADFFTGFDMNVQVAEHFAAGFAVVARIVKGNVLQADFTLWYLQLAGIIGIFNLRRFGQGLHAIGHRT